MKKIFLLLILEIITTICYTQSSIPVMANYPVLINIKDNSGSGFFFQDSSYFYLVTARHVLFQQRAGSNDYGVVDRELNILFYPQNSEMDSVSSITFDLEELNKTNNILFYLERDVAVIRLGTITHNTSIQYHSVIKSENVSNAFAVTEQNIKRFNDVIISNDVFILGYPKSLGLQNQPQYDFSRPLLRKGAIAGKNQAIKSIILDCPSYPGNSGGPVIEIENNNGYLVGIVVEFIPYEEKWVNERYGISNTSWQNSGYSIALSSDFFLDLIKEMEKRK